MRGRWLFGGLMSLLLLVFVVLGGVAVYNLGAQAAGAGTTGFPPILIGFGAVILFFLVMRLALGLVFFPLFGFGFGRMRRGWGPGGMHGWKHGFGRRGWDDGESVPPMVQEWHRRMHAQGESAGSEDPAAGA